MIPQRWTGGLGATSAELRCGTDEVVDEASTRAGAGSSDLLEIAARVAETGSLPPCALSTQLGGRGTARLETEPALAYGLMTRVFCGRWPDLAMQWLYEVGLLADLLPALAATATLGDGDGRHKDVWEHSKIVVRQAVRRPAVRWAAALHDVGKVPTRRFVGPSKVTFIGHEEVGAEMFRDGPARRFAFPPKIAERVERLIRFHLRPGQYDGRWTDAAVRRFARDMGPEVRDLLDLSRADVTSQRPGQRRRCLERISELGRRIRALKAADEREPVLPRGLGRALMDAFALPPGPQIGALRRRVEEICAAEGLAGESLGVEACLELIRGRGLLAELGVDGG